MKNRKGKEKNKPQLKSNELSSLRIERHQKTIWLQCFSVHLEIESERQRAAWTTGRLMAGITYKTNNHSRSPVHLKSIQSHQFTANPNVCLWTVGGSLDTGREAKLHTKKASGPINSNPGHCCCEATVLTTFHLGYLHMLTLFSTFLQLYSVGVSLGGLIDRRWKPGFSRCRRLRV